MAEKAPETSPAPAEGGESQTTISEPDTALPSSSSSVAATSDAAKPISFHHDLSSFSAEIGVLMVPALEDNYMYVLFDKASGQAAVVDPVEPAKLASVLKKLGLEVQMVLTTHSHWDHAGGNDKFKQLFPGVEVYGGKGDKAQGATKEVGDGDTIQLGGLKIKVLFTPCHTPGHVCYYVKESGPGVVFTGDTMFVAGCGNFNSGTPQQMRTAFEKLGALPQDTIVCCGHEYTIANLMYARFVEPGNKAIAAKLAWAQAQRAKNAPTVPSTLAEEAATSPFMRAVNKVPTLVKHCSSSDATECIRFVRKEKSAGAWKTAL